MVRKPSHGDATGASTEATKERKGLWSPEEDERLFAQITYHGVSTWSSVAQLAGLRRSGKSCRLRWMNYLRPDLKKEPISKREEEIIISLQQSLGNRWSAIAARMPGRTDNEIKNYWNSRIRKRLSAAAKSGAGGSSSSSTELAPAAVPAAEEKVEPEPINAATESAPMPIPARFPMFACQVLDGTGAACTPSSTTSTQQSTGDESEASVGDSDMIHFLSFDDLDYPADFLVDVPGAMDAWESELYPANSMSSFLYRY